MRADTRIPFMAMPDAIRSLLMLTETPREQLTRSVYNIAAFSLSAGEFRERALQAFPGAEISFEPNPRRQGIVDSWPEDVDDSRARADWGWSPDYDADRFFDDYFLPEIRKRYRCDGEGIELRKRPHPPAPLQMYSFGEGSSFWAAAASGENRGRDSS